MPPKQKKREFKLFNLIKNEKYYFLRLNCVNNIERMVHKQNKAD